MSYGICNMPGGWYYCPYMMRSYVPQGSIAGDKRNKTVKKIGDTEITYDNSQYRILPLLAIPLLFAAAGPRPVPFWGPPPLYYYYWYYYR